jgi:CBS domain containing-hemolysin-like protein
VLVLLLAVFELFLVASYEATFTVLSRSSLEKLEESRILRARHMLRIYEPRHRLRLMARLGAAVGVIALTLSLFFLARSLLSLYQLPQSYGTLIAVVGALCIFLAVSTPRRIRFAEEGEETRIPALALAFVPLHALLLPLTNLLDRLTSGDYSDEDFRAEKEEELRSFVESESESGVIEEGEREMIQSVFGFHDRIVREVMVPRVDMAAVELSASIQDLLNLIRTTGYSRLPLYEESLDRIRSIIYTKELLYTLVNRRSADLSMSLADFIAQESGRPDQGEPFTHEPYYVPETKKIDDLLHDMRAHRLRQAIVVDEYGGTAGLVTTEDLVEEIVGELQDEYDAEETLFHWQEPGQVLIASARMDIDDLNDLLDIDLPNEGFETLGGFIYDFLGRVPEQGLAFQTGHLEIKILKVEGQRISQVQIRRLEMADKADKSGAE